MLEKYTVPLKQSTPATVLTSDVYCAAYLLTQHCELSQVLKNERSRVSFVFKGSNVGRLRNEYRRGPVYVNVRFLREKLITLRRLMDGKQRSNAWFDKTHLDKARYKHHKCPQHLSPMR